ncbi:oxidoreductase [Tirmania nivea]|nr:oxidoreductase [Tirmania nivea]
MVVPYTAALGTSGIGESLVYSFATRGAQIILLINNAFPRRLDLILLCASHFPLPFALQQFTHNSADKHFSDAGFISWGRFSVGKPWQATGMAKLALMTSLLSFKAQTRAYVRKDKEPVNVRTFIVDPGFTRIPSTCAFITLGSLWGLLVYFFTYPLWWLVLKSPQQAGESFLFAVISIEGAQGEGGLVYRECREGEVRREEVYNADFAKTLWEVTEKEIAELEKKGALKRKRRKMEKEREVKKNGKKNVIEEIIEEVEKAKSEAIASGSEDPKMK